MRRDAHTQSRVHAKTHAIMDTSDSTHSNLSPLGSLPTPSCPLPPLPSLSSLLPTLAHCPSLGPGQARGTRSMEHARQAVRVATQEGGATPSSPAAWCASALLLLPRRGCDAQTGGAGTGAIAKGCAGQGAEEDSAARVAAIFCAACVRCWSLSLPPMPPCRGLGVAALARVPVLFFVSASCPKLLAPHRMQLPGDREM